MTAKKVPQRYQGICENCTWVGQERIKMSEAEATARDHAREKKHMIHVVDRFKLRVVGSGWHPKDGEGVR